MDRRWRSDWWLPALCGVVAVHLAASITGMTWGTPTSACDFYLFGPEAPWDHDRILAALRGPSDAVGGASSVGFGDERLGADVDPDPIGPRREPHVLNADERGTAELYVRFRLYSHQPDEMIVWRAIAGMSPEKFDFDPRLYQYGGLFIYPVAALLKVCAWAGWIDLKPDLGYYLDHPDAFGRFYIVSRACSAGWGAVAAVVLFFIARRLGGNAAGMLAAILFVAMPVVVCMAHEGKPHLPGAALMLLSVLLAQHSLDSGRSSPCTHPTDAAGDRSAIDGAQRRLINGTAAWWGMCAACGAATGMVLSSLPIMVLIPLTAWWRRSPTDRNRTSWLIAAVAGMLTAMAVYLLTNPYVAINAFINREVLRSNFGNSLAMYEIDRLAEGAQRMAELLLEGATPAALLTGVVGAGLVFAERRRQALPLLVPAGVMLAQFTLIGAGKPAEYGRFGVFIVSCAAITSACALVRAASGRSWARGVGLLVAAVVMGLTLRGGQRYLSNFIADAGTGGTRWAVAEAIERIAEDDIAGPGPRLAVLREPAPYNSPPLRFDLWPVVLLPSKEAFNALPADRTNILIETVDDPASGQTGLPGWRIRISGEVTPISWANKPFVLTVRPPGTPSREDE